jgi:arginyl-tRNA synthetase
MAITTSSLAELEIALHELSLAIPVPQYDEADVLDNPLSLCRSYLADLLQRIIGCEPEVAYRSIHWPNNIFNGDLTVTLPKLCPGVKPNEFVPELLKKV